MQSERTTKHLDKVNMCEKILAFGLELSAGETPVIFKK